MKRLTGVALSVLLVAGCSTTTTPTETAGSAIDHLQFQLPEQVPWQQIRETQLDNGRFSEWVIANYDDKTSPIRVIYHVNSPAMPAEKTLSEIVAPLQNACTDIKLTETRTISTYPNQKGVEAICAQVGDNGFGTVTYTTVFSDQTANHILVAEVKTPPSAQAGSLTANNEEQKKIVDQVQAIVGLMGEFSRNVQACDAQNVCQ